MKNLPIGHVSEKSDISRDPFHELICKIVRNSL